MKIEDLKEVCEEILDSAKSGYPLRISDDEAVAMSEAVLRLAAIENAGDEEVELMLKTIGGDASDSEKTNAFLWLRWIFKSRNATTADLRAKLGEATERIQDLEDGIEAVRLGL